MGQTAGVGLETHTTADLEIGGTTVTARLFGRGAHSPGGSSPLSIRWEAGVEIPAFHHEEACFSPVCAASTDVFGGLANRHFSQGAIFAGRGGAERVWRVVFQQAVVLEAVRHLRGETFSVSK